MRSTNTAFIDFVLSDFCQIIASVESFSNKWKILQDSNSSKNYISMKDSGLVDVYLRRVRISGFNVTCGFPLCFVMLYCNELAPE